MAYIVQSDFIFITGYDYASTIIDFLGQRKMKAEKKRPGKVLTMQRDLKSSLPEPPYIRIMGRISDRRIAVIERLRAEAVQRLQLPPGCRVLDAGCGNGGSFRYLLD